MGVPRSASCGLSYAGRSPIVSRTVTGLSGAPSWEWTARKTRGGCEGTMPSTLMLSCAPVNTCWGTGQSGSFSPGAAPQMKARFLDWETP